MLDHLADVLEQAIFSRGYVMNKKACRAIAEELIGELRMPTEPVLEAMMQNGREQSKSFTVSPASIIRVTPLWQAAIDAILAEPSADNPVVPSPPLQPKE